MVLSGLIFTIGTYGHEIRYWRFLQNRFLRTYPLFLFVLFLGISTSPEKFELVPMIQTLVCLGNVKGALHMDAFTGMFWAVAIEWQFYLLFPFLLLFLNRKGVRYLIGLLGTMFVMRIFACIHGANIRDLVYLTIAGRMDQFLIGMGAGVYYRTAFKPGRAKNILFAVSAVLLVAVMFVYHRLGGWGSEDKFKLIWPTVEGLAWAFFLVTYLSAGRHLPNALSKALAAIGTTSYSIYLLHALVVISVVNLEWIIKLPRLGFIESAVVNAVLIMIPATLAVATLTYWVIEKPFLEMRVRYKKT